MGGRPYVLIVDDTLTAQCLQRLLECEFPGVEIVANGQGWRNAVATSKPDLILLDLKTPGFNGFDVTRQLRDMSPTTKVIVVTIHDEPEYVAEAFRAGASGYLLKWCAVSELVTAMRIVLKGDSYTTPSLADRAPYSIKNRQESSNRKDLTSRQREVLQLVALGRTAKEIANALGLSVKTAVFHKMAVMNKLGLRTTADLTRYALEHGILSCIEKPQRPLPSPLIPLAQNSTSA